MRFVKKIMPVIICALLMLCLSLAAYAVDETTEAPTTEVPTTEEPTTEEPTTEEPTAEEPTTEVPTTEEPTTEEPTEPVTVPDEQLLKGDIDRDGRVSPADARLILQFSARLRQFTQKACIIADMNSDKAVTAYDARLALRTAARLEGSLPVGDVSTADDISPLDKYDHRVKYEPMLAGFSTNIIDENVFPKLRELEKYLSRADSSITFHFTDVNEQYYIKYNSDRVFRTQCTVKAPYVKSMMTYMEANNIPMGTMLTLKDSQKWADCYVSGFPTGNQYTVCEILRYALRLSDNTAYQMLFDYFGPDVLNTTAERLGVGLRLDDYIFGYASADDMTKLFLDIYHYDGKHKKELDENLEDSKTSPQIRLGIPEEVRVLRKSGNGGSATPGFHDCAIVLSETPFVLVIYTAINSNGSRSSVPFSTIASIVYDININLAY